MTTLDVLVVAEHRAGEVEPVTHQLVAQALAVSPGARVSLLALQAPGAGVAAALTRAGAHRLLVCEHEALASYNPEAYCRTVEHIARRLSPDLLVCGHTFQGMEVGPWVAARLGRPLASNCVEVCVRDGRLAAERLVYGGAWQVGLSLPLPAVVTLARRGAPAKREAREADIERVDPPGLGGLATEIVASIAPQMGEGDITRSDVVVGVGRGIKDPANLALIEELAEVLGGVVACSRPLVDLEWMPHERQVGASGREINARVYLACGISGAAQHLAGIGGVQTVIAINKDASAPIFGMSHVGVVGDLFEVVPALIAEARKRRGSLVSTHEG
jgi:electron transfer flavoprotein alpha subunit